VKFFYELNKSKKSRLCIAAFFSTEELAKKKIIYSAQY